MLKLPTLLFFLFTTSICYCQTDTIFIADNTPTVKVKANEPFVLKFITCHSCGYSWSLNSVDSSFVKLIGVTSEHTTGRKGIAGGNVFEFWKFKVIAAGSYVLDFVYKRPWLKENKKISRVELDVY